MSTSVRLFPAKALSPMEVTEKGISKLSR
ncbi:uncharacterized protein METZ01_LOCUS192855, partial [marine metagenome]